MQSATLRKFVEANRPPALGTWSAKELIDILTPEVGNRLMRKALIDQPAIIFQEPQPLRPVEDIYGVTEDGRAQLTIRADSKLTIDYSEGYICNEGPVRAPRQILRYSLRGMDVGTTTNLWHANTYFGATRLRDIILELLAANKGVEVPDEYVVAELPHPVVQISWTSRLAGLHNARVDNERTTVLYCFDYEAEALELEIGRLTQELAGLTA